MTKVLNFLFIIYNFKRDRFFVLNDVIHIHTLHHFNDDVCITFNVGKTETIGAGIENVKISSNPDKLLPKISLQSN